MSSRKKVVDFERSLQQLEALVEALEEGNLSLEDSLKSFEQGVRITRECQQALKSAEQRIAILTQDLTGESDPNPFLEPDTDIDDGQGDDA
ncbi:MAG: exodeoxyribonuclease VII small subunit [Porticoccaceae bacterium]